jgi:hypothetical protein
MRWKREVFVRNNRIFALCYRCAAFALCLAGILQTMGVSGGEVSWVILLYYTTQSNILTLGMFGILAVRTALAIKQDGTRGASSFFERMSAIVMLSITVTFLLYWVMLAPFMSGSIGIFSFANLQVHTITPLAMMFDYFFFAQRGKLKKRDPLLFALIPYAYLAQCTILGFSGVRYHVPGSDTSTRFPYFFVDFDISGAMVFVYLAVFSGFFLALAFLLLRFDKMKKRPNPEQTANS